MYAHICDLCGKIIKTDKAHKYEMKLISRYNPYTEMFDPTMPPVLIDAHDKCIRKIFDNEKIEKIAKELADYE